MNANKKSIEHVHRDGEHGVTQVVLGVVSDLEIKLCSSDKIVRYMKTTRLKTCGFNKPFLRGTYIYLASQSQCLGLDEPA